MQSDIINNKNIFSKQSSARLEAMISIATQYTESHDHARAATFWKRAWIISNGDPHIKQKLLESLKFISSSVKDLSPFNSDLKHACETGDLSSIVSKYNQQTYYSAMKFGTEDFEFDFDIMQKMKASVHSLNSSNRLLSLASDTDKPRAIYICSNIANTGSVLAKLQKSIIEHHNLDQFKFAITFTDSALDLYTCEDSWSVIEYANDMGWEVYLSDYYEAGQRITDLSKRISKDGPIDLVVTNSVLATAEAFLLAMALPAQKRIAHVMGTPPLFAAAYFDYYIASDDKLLLECPGDGETVPVEVDLITNSDITPINKSFIGLTQYETLILGAGRTTKFTSDYIQIIGDVLQENMDAYFLAIGIPQEQEESFKQQFPQPVQGRVLTIGWIKNYLPFLNLADVVIDTFPAGGGVTIMDAMALGIPAITLSDDIHRPDIHLNEWMVAYTYTLPELTFKYNELENLTATVCDLLNKDTTSFSQRSIAQVRALRGNPKRMVSAYERIYKETLYS